MVAGLAAATAATILLPGRAGAVQDSKAPAYRTATDLLAALASGKISARELLDATIARIEALDPRTNAVVVRDFDRARVSCRCRRRRTGTRRTPCAAGPAHDRQGTIQRCRTSDVVGLPAVPELAPRCGRACRAAAQGRWSRHHRQDQCTGRADRLAKLQRRLWHHQQSLGFDAHSRRILGRFRGGARRWVRVVGAWLGHRRLAPRAGAFLRRLRPQAESRPGPAARLGLSRNAADPGSRRSGRDWPDGAQRGRSCARTGRPRRAGRVVGRHRLQARTAATAARQPGGFSRAGHRHPSAVPDSVERYRGACWSERTPRQTRLHGDAIRCERARPGAHVADLPRAAVGGVQHRVVDR